MAATFRSLLATYLADLVAVGGLAMTVADLPGALETGSASTELLADLALLAGALLAHRLALAPVWEAPMLALGLLAIASLGVVALTGRWWVAALGGTAAVVGAPHFVPSGRAWVWLAAGVLLTVPAVLSSPAAGGGAALFALAAGLVSRRLADRARGTAAKRVLELEQELQMERARAADYSSRLSRGETREERLRRRSLLRGALTRRMGAVEAIAQSIARDLRQASSDGVGLAEAVERSVHRAEHLSRVAAGGAAREQQATLPQIWPRVRDLVEPLRHEAHHVEASVPADLPPVPGTGEAWVQILAALIENAFEAMPHGGVVRVRGEPADEATVRIVVEDTGRGIPADVLTHVTEPFYTSRSEAGAEGLGLAMVASLVEGLDGELRLSSVAGEGTTVVIEVPVAVPSAAPLVEPERLQGTVLLADDDRETRRGIARLMESLGLEVVETDSGTVARTHLTAQPERFRAAILDVVMPGTPVGEIVAEVRLRRPDFPVLLISGYDTMRMVDSVLGMGGVRFLRKPFTRGEIHAALRDLFTAAAKAP
jgi:signal transduction histidine kinase/CheY-like chemotaxis protein